MWRVLFGIIARTGFSGFTGFCGLVYTEVMRQSPVCTEIIGLKPELPMVRQQQLSPRGRLGAGASGFQPGPLDHVPPGVLAGVGVGA